MRLMLALTVLPLPTLAHTGHVGELAGHDHWVAGAAIGIAAGIALWQIVRDRKAKRSEEAAEAEADAAPEDQTA